MVWVRRVRTHSGATAMQIMESVDGKRRVVRHVGSAGTEVALGALMLEAQRLMVDDAQGELDVGLTPTVPRTRLVSATPVQASLAGGPAPAGRKKVERIAAPRVLRTSSPLLLYDENGGVYDSIGFGDLADAMFRDMVTTRIVEPTSLLDVDCVLADLGRVEASLTTRRRTFQRCHDGKYHDRLAELCFAYAGL